uniref:Uncharacterized protein n=1 Tax=Acrobeloides nanus TaxID=290746 RepID=A0A914CY21_9BILA
MSRSKVLMVRSLSCRTTHGTGELCAHQSKNPTTKANETAALRIEVQKLKEALKKITSAAGPSPKANKEKIEPRLPKSPTSPRKAKYFISYLLLNCIFLGSKNV